MRLTGAFAASVLTVAVPSAILLSVGCAGGQTGGITELDACHVDSGEGDFDEMAGVLARVGSEHAAPIVQGTSGELAIALEVDGPARLLGGEGCETPRLVTVARVHIRTADGAFDDELLGSATRYGEDTITVRAALPVADFRGTAALPDEADGRGRVVVRLSLDRDGVHGSVAYEPPSDAVDGTQLALF